jgi:chitin deacetylase
MMPSPRLALSCFVLAACACAALGLSPATSDWTVPRRYAGQVVNHRVRFFPQKILALTFDDGPDPINTPVVLRALATYHAHATFFVLGGIAKRHPELIRKIVAGGNCVGNHSFSHPSSTTADRALRELTDTAAAIKKAIGRNPTCFRPPYGILKGTLAHTAQKLGYPVITWTISSADTRPIDSKFIANNVIHTPNPGDIVLMHDGAGHKATAAAVPIILRELSAAGYRFVTLPELFRAWDEWLRKHPASQAPAQAKGRRGIKPRPTASAKTRG